MKIEFTRQTWIFINFTVIGLLILLIGSWQNIKEFIIIGFIMTVIMSPLLRLVLPKKMLEEKI